MSVKEFNKLFGIQVDPEEEKEKFVQRINLTIFSEITEGRFYYPYSDLFREVCYKLGINSADMIGHANQFNYGSSAIIPSIRKLTCDNFIETLKILVVTYEIITPDYKTKFNNLVEQALGVSAVDLEVRWKDGLFYPSGAKELDDKLISENLEWLSEFSDVKQFFTTSLQHFKNSLGDASARKDAITNAYTSIEKISQIVLQNKKTFDNNSNELVKLLNLPTEYKNIVHYYKQIAHGYSSRHAGSNISHIETEAFIYFTGILLRLISQK